MNRISFSSRALLLQRFPEEAKTVFPQKDYSPLVFWSLTDPEVSKKFYSVVYEDLGKSFCCVKVGDVRLPKSKNTKKIELIAGTVIHKESVVCLLVSMKYPFPLLEHTRTTDKKEFDLRVSELVKSTTIVNFEKFRGNISEKTCNDDFSYALNKPAGDYFTFKLVPAYIQVLIDQRYVGTFSF